MPPLILLLFLLLLLPACKPKEESAQAPSTALLLPAAPYPTLMWEQLASLKDIRVTREKAEHPSNLDWQDGLHLPEIGDPAAKKGGSIHLLNVGPYPAHLRTLSGLEQVFFHYTLYANINIKLVELHPNNPQQDIISGLAQSWAVSEDGKSVTFRLHPHARYSNGRPVRAADFALGIYLRSFDYIKDPFAFQKITQSIASLTIHDEHTLTVGLHRAQLLAPYHIASLLHPAEPSFYADFGPDYTERYAQRLEPTTGAYTVASGDFTQNREIVLSKVPQWWAAQLPYYRYRYNVDKRHIHFLSDEAQAWEFFLNGKLDLLQTRNVAAWNERLDHPHVHEGRIEKHRFRAHYPLPPYGIYLNTKTLPDLKLRRGILHALDMNRALDTLFRGDYERLHCFSEGYGSLIPYPDRIGQYDYDPTRARALFTQLGYTQQDDRGILRKPDGTRLSLTLKYVPSEKVSSLAQQLAQSARLCGLEIVLAPLSWQQCSEAVEGKSYQLAFWADVASFPLPSLEKQFHSRFQESRGVNLHAIADAQIDTQLDMMQHAKTQAELAAATQRINERIAELALWLPGWKENRASIANWRHIRFPDTAHTRFSIPHRYDVQEAHLLWVDESNYPTRGSYPEVDRLITPVMEK